jgi:GH35 family endo-1,4-beta-xylanase
VLAAVVALVASGCIKDVAVRADVTFGLHIQGNTELERTLTVLHADATTNHGLSWSVIEPVQGQWDFTFADTAYAFAVEHGLRQTGMSFAWDQ